MPEWLKYKRYPHIGVPLERKNEKRLLDYVMNPKAIEHHAFFPLIRRSLISRPYKRITEGGREIRKCKVKVREISYATHLDAAIYSYYAYKLSERYEEFLALKNLGHVVAAYRKIPCEGRAGNKCNIEIAYEVFQFIKTKLAQGEELAVITFDIKGFFDNLDHKLLKTSWKNILQNCEMKNDVYTVYKSIVRYSYIMEEDLFELFKDRIICEGPSGYKNKRIKREKYLRNKNAIAFCERKSIKEIVNAKLIRTRPKTEAGRKGIPQGLPISAILANIYMSTFDELIAKDIESFDGLYRRYSDDIIIVCPARYGCFWKEWMINEIKTVKLEIQPQKTNLFEFSLRHPSIVCSHEFKGENIKLEYLGFSFDGNKILIKQSGLGHYYYRMAKAVARSKRNAINIKNKTQGKIFENKLLNRFSYIGARKHKIFTRIKGQKSQFICFDNNRSHGNFITYARKASNIMNEPAIIKQLRKNKHKLKSYIIKSKKDIRKVLQG